MYNIAPAWHARAANQVWRWPISHQYAVMITTRCSAHTYAHICVSLRKHQCMTLYIHRWDNANAQGSAQGLGTELCVSI